MRSFLISKGSKMVSSVALARSVLPLFLGLMLSLQLAAQTDYTVKTVPNPRKQTPAANCSNPDSVLSDSAISELELICLDAYLNYELEVAVVALKSIGQANQDEFATELFNHWGIGNADTDRGLLVLLVMNNKTTTFRSGNGIEAMLTDDLCLATQEQLMNPQFREGKFDQGMIDGTRQAVKFCHLDTLEACSEIAEFRLVQYESCFSQVYTLISKAVSEKYDDTTAANPVIRRIEKLQKLCENTSHFEIEYHELNRELFSAYLDLTAILDKQNGSNALGQMKSYFWRELPQMINDRSDAYSNAAMRYNTAVLNSDKKNNTMLKLLLFLY